MTQALARVLDLDGLGDALDHSGNLDGLEDLLLGQALVAHGLLVGDGAVLATVDGGDSPLILKQTNLSS